MPGLPAGLRALPLVRSASTAHRPLRWLLGSCDLRVPGGDSLTVTQSLTVSVTGSVTRSSILPPRGESW